MCAEKVEYFTVCIQMSNVPEWGPLTLKFIGKLMVLFFFFYLLAFCLCIRVGGGKIPAVCGGLF